MPIPEESNKSWLKEKEALKVKFELIISKYSMFEETAKGSLSEKLERKLAKTKEELHRIIAGI